MLKPLSFERAHELVHYDPDTGRLTWKVANSNRNRNRIGQEAGGSLMKGYKRLRIDGETYSHHAVAWLLQTGSWPTRDIDHRNRVKTDNRWANLRAATKSQNQANRPGWAGRELPKGVHRNKNGTRYCAIGSARGRPWHLGTFDTPEQASAAYLAFASRVHGGSFACTE